MWFITPPAPSLLLLSPFLFLPFPIVASFSWGLWLVVWFITPPLNLELPPSESF